MPRRAFFDALGKDAWAVVNIDDRNGEVMVQNTRAKVYRLSLRSMADYRTKIVEMLPNGMLLHLDDRELWVKFTGRFNAYNLTTVYAAARLLGVDKEEVLTTLSALTPVSGRFETIMAKDGTMAVVDYAHTPDALDNVIQTINEVRREGQQAHRCMWLWWRPRPHEAPRDGTHSRKERHDRHPHLRQPSHRVTRGHPR